MRNLLLSLTLAAGLPGALAQGPQSSYLMRYDKPAEYFEEAMVIGNGTIGAIVYGGTARTASRSTTSHSGPASPRRG